jgi:hypothetical protein
MESIYKDFSKAGKNLFFTLTSAGKCLFSSRFSLQLPKAQTNNCIVIANGPSFMEDYEKNKSIYLSHDCIVTNMFALAPIFLEIKPKYYIWLDGFMWDSSNDSSLQTTEIILGKVDWPMTILLPQFAKCDDLIKRFESNSNLTIKRYNYVYYKGINSIGHALYRKQLMCPRMLSVTSMALFLAINMKYKNIFLSGADQNWHQRIVVDENNVVNTALEHFYDGEKKFKYQPFYKQGKSNLGTNTMSDFFWIMLKTFEGYDQVAAYSKSLNAKIFNVSKHSFVDAFEKEEIQIIKDL